MWIWLFIKYKQYFSIRHGLTVNRLDVRLSFQFRLLHRIILCNKWLNTIKIKSSDQCSYCGSIDDIPHFFIKCPKVLIFWNYWINWWEIISGIEIKNSSILHECILFGFPNSNPEKKEKIHVFNYCILYTKYYIYIKRLFQDNSLDVYACQMQIKAVIEIEFNICKKKKQYRK